MSIDYNSTNVVTASQGYVQYINKEIASINLKIESLWLSIAKLSERNSSSLENIDNESRSLGARLKEIKKTNKRNSILTFVSLIIAIIAGCILLKDRYFP